MPRGLNCSDSEQQLQIAECLQKDYIKAIEEATEGCFKTVLDELQTSVVQDPDRLVFWSTPLTNFRVRNVNVKTKTCSPRWGGRTGSHPFSEYFPAETIHIEDIISRLDEPEFTYY